MSDDINLAQVESHLVAALTGNGLGGLRAGATGQPAVSAPAELLAERRWQREQRTLEDTTWLARETAMAYREAMGDRREREQRREREPSP